MPALLAMVLGISDAGALLKLLGRLVKIRNRYMHIIWREYTRLNNEVTSPAYRAHMEAALDKWDIVKAEVKELRDVRRTSMPTRDEVVANEWTLLKVGRELERWKRVRAVWKKKVMPGQQTIWQWIGGVAQQRGRGRPKRCGDGDGRRWL